MGMTRTLQRQILLDKYGSGGMSANEVRKEFRLGKGETSTKIPETLGRNRKGKYLLYNTIDVADWWFDTTYIPGVRTIGGEI